jgi:hypothetical protein
MSRSRVVVAVVAASALLGGSAALAARPAVASGHQPRLMLTLDRAVQPRADSPLTPPAPPCPLPKVTVPLPDTSVPLVGGDTTVGPCLMVPELAGTGAPVMGNMAYWGGHVQVHPRVYLVYLGWGRPDAFTDDCTPVHLVEGAFRATLKCDPDGAGQRMADFVHQLGGTEWAGVQSQYYQVVNGVKTYVKNDRNQLGGIWVDDTTKTSSKISYRDMAVEADKARRHFGIKDKDVFDANVVILQPQHFSDPKAQSVGYCAWHDMIQPSVMPDEFKGLKPNLPFTNMPYVLNQGDSCGAHLINSGAAGRLDGFTIALGHEIEEAVTDPGAEDRLGGTAIGGWFDPLDANENGDKCAYVGSNIVMGGSIAGFPGVGGNIRGNAGGRFPVQSLWSNTAAGGAGYCAGAGSDLPF